MIEKKERPYVNFMGMIFYAKELNVTLSVNFHI